MEVISKSLLDTEKVASDLMGSIKKDNNSACVISLSGDLGSGKTTLVQMIGKILGVKENILSPTFVIEKIYKLNNTEFDSLIHIDAYRIDDVKELKVLGWEDVVDNPRNLVVIEWGDKIDDILPSNTTRVYLEFIDKNSRRIRW